MAIRHHLVVLREPYLRLLLAGPKRIECRLSSIRRPPFEAVSPGDMLYFKLPSGPVRAIAVAGGCRFQQLKSEADLARLVEHHGPEICAEAGFFEDARTWARFVSLVWIDTVVGVSPMTLRKSDQRGWVVLAGPPRPGAVVAGSEVRAPASLRRPRRN